MIIRLTPVHLRALSIVRDRQIIWSAQTGPFGGFTYADGARIPPSSDLVALYELRNADLITVNRFAGQVALTRAGMAHLSEQLPHVEAVGSTTRVMY